MGNFVILFISSTYSKSSSEIIYYSVNIKIAQVEIERNAMKKKRNEFTLL